MSYQRQANWQSSMIDFIFTIDYEIYGNGEGSLRELVYEPAQKLKTLFQESNARFVFFVEAAELEKIEEEQTDDCIGSVRRQVRESYLQGFEIGLHLHPQWCNARYREGKWLLDYSEYNLCRLSKERITEIIGRSVAYLRTVLGRSDFTPLSFRAGNWLLQPTKTAAAALAETGMKIDSSVFKGGFQRGHKLDYRPACGNGYYWRFLNDVNRSDPDGSLIEIPTYTLMVPFWKMLSSKRVGLQRKSPSTFQHGNHRVNRLLNYLRPWYPLKLDFCRQTADELISMMEKIIRDDRNNPASYKPIVAIGHTKDLVDIESIRKFLSYLQQKGIAVTTFKEAYEKHMF